MFCSSQPDSEANTHTGLQNSPAASHKHLPGTVPQQRAEGSGRSGGQVSCASCLESSVLTLPHQLGLPGHGIEHRQPLWRWGGLFC